MMAGAGILICIVLESEDNNKQPGGTPPPPSLKAVCQNVIKQKGNDKMYQTIKMIQKTKELTQQQKRTLTGQCLAGDIQGAIKGYTRLLRRKELKK